MSWVLDMDIEIANFVAIWLMARKDDQNLNISKKEVDKTVRVFYVDI
jgi:hypothetical protein